MRRMPNFNSLFIIVILCCISSFAYAAYDGPISIPTPVSPFDPQSIIVTGEADGGLEFSLSPDRKILPNTPRFNGVPPIDIGGTLFDSYNLGTNSYGVDISGGVSYTTLKNYGAVPIDEFGNAEIKPFIDLSLENPTASDLLSIDAWQYFPDTHFETRDVIYSVTDFVINIDVIIHELNTIALCVASGIGATVEVGALPEGNYTVNANIYLMPLGGSELTLYDALDSISFNVAPSFDESIKVIPEPTTVLLLGMGALTLRRRKRA